jgi:hypothetical protein
MAPDAWFRATVGIADNRPVIPGRHPADWPRWVSIEVNNPEQKYLLRSMDGKFSGLQLACIMHVG